MSSVSTQYYPYAKCLNPRVVTNPYTHERIIATCGHCEACINRKMQSNEMKCKLESQSAVYSMFVTLTYNDDNIPLLRPQKLSQDVCCCDVTERFQGKPESELSVVSHLSHEDLTALLDKFNLNGCIPYLCKSDLQKFIKRFRFQANKLYNEKVRYYAVGEYGPVHYRPHFHVIFFFQSRQLAEDFGKILRKVWKYGYFDYSLSEGSCAQYTTSYVNSYLCVPSLLKAAEIRPFSAHSFYLGMGHFENRRKEIYEIPFRDVVKQVLPIGGNVNEIRMSATFFRYFFPKCKGFVNKSNQELYDSYLLYLYAEKDLGDMSPMDMAKYIADLIRDGSAFGVSPTSSPLAKVVSYFLNSYDGSKLYFLFNSDDTEEQKKYITRIYSELRISKHFIKYCCSDIHFGYQVRERINHFKELYKYIDYQGLTDTLLWQEDNITDETIDYINFFYSNPKKCNYDDLRKTKIYRNFYTDTHLNFSNAVKHKRLNDLNNIFNNM